MANTWKRVDAEKHIDAKMEDVQTVTVKDYKRDMRLENIGTNQAYRVDGVHLYADIVNLDEMLEWTKVEGERVQKRTLQFLNLHYRAVNRVLLAVSAKRIDFHNQRLHALVATPYNTEDDAEAKRVKRAVAIAQLIIDVLKETGDASESIPAAKARVGIDSGTALAVNNGRNGYREPLFLGPPANHAAKLASNNDKVGIFLTNEARIAIGLDKVTAPEKQALSTAEITTCQDSASLDVTVKEIVDAWSEDLDKFPVGAFDFSRKTPPLSDLDIVTLTPKNSVRQELVSLYADIDGFTNYVADHIDDNAEDVVRTLHVLRAELERVVTSVFKGRRVRFIGDCVHALLCEGTAHTTDAEATVTQATLLSGGLRSSFELALERLQSKGYETGDLGLQIGFEYGPTSVSRLGIQGDRVRCAVSRAVLKSETEQLRCSGNETAIGKAAYDEASSAVQKLFSTSRKVSDLDYNEAVEALSANGDERAGEAQKSAYASVAAVARPATASVSPRPHAEE